MMFLLKTNEIFAVDPIDSTEKLIITCSNEVGAKLILDLLNLNTNSSLRGFKGGVINEINHMSYVLCDIVSIIRKYSGSEEQEKEEGSAARMSKEIRDRLEEMRQNGCIRIK